MAIGSACADKYLRFTMFFYAITFITGSTSSVGIGSRLNVIPDWILSHFVLLLFNLLLIVTLLQYAFAFFKLGNWSVVCLYGESTTQ